MKHLFIVLFAMILISSFAFAQSNEADVLQEGNENTADVSQEGNDNRVWVDQIGDDNEAIITQLGDDNIGDVIQKGNSDWAKQDQDGSTNDAIIRQGLINEGEGNESEQKQIGEGHFAYIQQGGDPTWTPGLVSNYNYAEQHQYVSNHLAYIWQFGDNNTAKQDQRGGTNNWAVIMQGGGWGWDITNDNNWAEIFQDGSDNEAGIWQWEGDFNEAYIRQEDSDEGVARVVQEGHDNLFRLKQTGHGNVVGEESSPFTQEGDGNKFAGVERVGDDLEFKEFEYALQTDGATLDVSSYQHGNDNIIGLRQGANDWALIQQTNDGNTALLWQGGGGQNATIIQDGNQNHAEVQQTP